MSSGRILAVPMSICRYTCMESAEMISPPTARASIRDSSVFPAAVGPVRMISGFFVLIIYTILLNFFSSSRLDMAMMVGLPWGQ